MNFNITSFLKLGYWFGDVPSVRRETLAIYFVVLGLLFLFGLVCKVVASKHGMSGAMRVALRYFSVWGISGAITGAALLFLRYQQTPLFTLRFWFGLWFVCYVVWAVCIIVRYFKKVQTRS